MEFIFIALFIVLGFALAFLSKYLEDPVVLFVGTTIIFIISLNLFVNGMEIQKQEYTEELFQYGNNFTGYHWDYDTGTAPDEPQTDAYLFHKNITTTIIYEDRKDIYTRGVGLSLTMFSIYLYFVMWQLYKKNQY
jgi:hypothetical protein